MLVLASQSPRRAELLRQLGVDFVTRPVAINEQVLPKENPQDYVSRLALQKAQVGLQLADSQNLVLGSDTTVVQDQKILGKPEDKQDFVAMMALLSGRTHQVYTAVAVVSAQQQWQALVSTQVSFKELTDAEIDWYWHTGEPLDKAGGYGIQGKAGQFVTQIQGSYSAVVGLPLYETAQLLQQAGMLNYGR